MQENIPCLVAVQPLEDGYEEFQKILVTSEEFSIGRSRSNSIVIPYLSISRNHCILRKVSDDWTIQDKSTVGIDINGVKLGRDNTRKLKTGDVIELEPAFKFRFISNPDEDSQPLRKRIKLDTANMEEDLITNMKVKFDQSQTNEIRHLAVKIYSTQQRQLASRQLKEHIKTEYLKKLEQLECEFTSEIYNLRGTINEVESQKVTLEEERDSQVTTIKQEMEEKIAELMTRINHDSQLESMLMAENNLLKEKLQKDREEFMAELKRETMSKQTLLQKLELKIKEQEELRVKEREELEKQQKIHNEQLRALKENELKELAEQKIRREEELLQELSFIKQNLEGQVEQMEIQRCQAEEQLLIQMKEMKKTNEEDKEKMKQLILERQNMENKLYRSQQTFEVELKKLRAQVSKREVELAALASERIEKQAEQSSQVINALQAQLEKVKNQLESVENEKNQLIACIPVPSTSGNSSKQSALAEVGELMENELQCSICAELFVEAITLNCSHTFCKFCITVWKRKKKECPICRKPIALECKSLVLDSFIDKMVQNLPNEMKEKRAELLKNREEEVVKMNSRSSRQAGPRVRRGHISRPSHTGPPHGMILTETLPSLPTVDLTSMNSSHPYMQPVQLSVNPLIQAVLLQGLPAHVPGRRGNIARHDQASTSNNNEDVEFVGESHI